MLLYDMFYRNGYDSNISLPDRPVAKGFRYAVCTNGPREVLIWDGEWLDKCPICGTRVELRTCEDCHKVAAVIDCGHYEQPAEIAASQFGGGFTCQECESERNNDSCIALAGESLADNE